jgi:6-phosphogluconolactonase
MMKKTIQIFTTIEMLSEAFANILVTDVSKKPPGSHYSIALSGGSTPLRIFGLISENYHDNIDWTKVLVFWGDERCVPPTDDESNYKMAYESLLQNIKIPEYNLYRIRGENDPLKESKRYAALVAYLLPEKSGIPHFDLFLLGIGEDGHTASVFPDQISLMDSKSLFEPAINPETKQKRITATGRLINNARKVVFLVTGENKADILVQILEKKKGTETIPATHIQPAEGELIWMLDSAAATKLSKK